MYRSWTISASDRTVSRFRSKVGIDIMEDKPRSAAEGARNVRRWRTACCRTARVSDGRFGALVVFTIY